MTVGHSGTVVKSLSLGLMILRGVAWNGMDPSDRHSCQAQVNGASRGNVRRK